MRHLHVMTIVSLLMTGLARPACSAPTGPGLDGTADQPGSSVLLTPVPMQTGLKICGVAAMLACAVERLRAGPRR